MCGGDNLHISHMIRLLDLRERYSGRCSPSPNRAGSKSAEQSSSSSKARITRALACYGLFLKGHAAVVKIALVP